MLRYNTACSKYGGYFFFQTENDNSLHHKKGHGGMKSSGDVSSSAKICDDPCYMPPDAINGMVIHVMEVTGCQVT